MKYEPGSPFPDPQSPAYIFAEGGKLAAIEDLDTDYGATYWPPLFEAVPGINEAEDQRLQTTAARLAMSYNVCRHIPLEVLEKMFNARIGFDISDELDDAINRPEQADEEVIIELNQAIADGRARMIQGESWEDVKKHLGW